VEVQSLKEQSMVPSPGDIVTARVLVVKSRQCMCEIKCIGEVTLSRPFRAVLRQEDVRATEKDRVKMYECFAPGDIILARVVSLTITFFFSKNMNVRISSVLFLIFLNFPILPIFSSTDMFSSQSWTFTLINFPLQKMSLELSSPTVIQVR